MYNVFKFYDNTKNTANVSVVRTTTHQLSYCGNNCPLNTDE